MKRRLSYSTVFSKYELPLPDRLARFAYSFYKKTRIGLSKWFPLKEYEKFHFENPGFRDEPSSDMPLGFNYLTKETEDGYINLDYVDFYDYLPKEDLDIFKQALKRFVVRNKPAPFGPLRSAKDDGRIDTMGRYIDRRSFSNLYVVKLIHNRYLEEFSPQVSISLRNLSSSFLVVKYRFYISNRFNEDFNAICKTRYLPYTDIFRPFNIPWYRPRKFGTSLYTGNDGRRRGIYTFTTNFKWNAFKELRKYFPIYFERNHLFPPTFETYSTNIRPNSNPENIGFWSSVMWGFQTDYAPKYNLCVCWDYKCGQHEGIRLSAYCGGNYTDSDQLPEIAKHELSDIYAVYMTASSLRNIAERDIAICNKKISKAIRKEKISSVLKVRVQVEQELYYSYRFISEFSGDTIDYDDAKEFYSHIYKYKSDSRTMTGLKNISKFTSETKQQIDTLLHVLDDAAEYGSSKFNMNLQRFMMAVTVLSLITAIMALLGFDQNTLKAILNTVFRFF